MTPRCCRALGWPSFVTFVDSGVQLFCAARLDPWNAVLGVLCVSAVNAFSGRTCLTNFGDPYKFGFPEFEILLVFVGGGDR